MRRRSGFTITELLVAMALIVFIMYILAEAFSAGSSAFRNLKAIGDLNEKLRTSGQTIRRALQADHFEDKRRVSDPDFWKSGPPNAGFLRLWQGSSDGMTPDGLPAANREGIDADGNVSARAVDHGLHFTVKHRGNNRGDFFRAGVPAGSPLSFLPFQDTRFQEAGTNSVSSSWGEVAVFMVPTGERTEDVEGATVQQPLYALHLRQRALVPDNQLVSDVCAALKQTRVPATAYPQYAELSCHVDPADKTSLYFNGPADLTMPARRMGPWFASPGNAAGAQPMCGPATAGTSYPRLGDENPAAPGVQGGLAGNDVLLTNVLSFEVRVLLDQRQWYAYYTAVGAPAPLHDFVPLSHPAVQSFSRSNPAFSVNNGPRVFDTWSQARDDYQDYLTPVNPNVPLWQEQNRATTVPLYQNAAGDKVRIVAVQISIRIWDVNTKQTRQSSVVVDL